MTRKILKAYRGLHSDEVLVAVNKNDDIYEVARTKKSHLMEPFEALSEILGDIDNMINNKFTNFKVVKIGDTYDVVNNKIVIPCGKYTAGNNAKEK